MLDTDTCIAIIKRQPPSALKKLRGKSIGQVGLSCMTLGELAFGAAKSVRREQAHTIGPLDTIIGAHALALDVILVTHNTREFARIEGLRVEDWLA